MNNIILIGYMGCGKSSLGRRLSDAGKAEFFDTDAWIEGLAGCCVSEIFARRGEAVFRQMETECLVHLRHQREGKVIAVGGGLPLRKQNRRLLKTLGKVIYLKASPETVWERIKNDTKRPLLQTPDPQHTIRQMMGDREEAYLAAADRVILVDDKSMEEVTGELLKLLEEMV